MIENKQSDALADRADIEDFIDQRFAELAPQYEPHLDDPARITESGDVIMAPFYTALEGGDPERGFVRAVFPDDEAQEAHKELLVNLYVQFEQDSRMTRLFVAANAGRIVLASPVVLVVDAKRMQLSPNHSEVTHRSIRLSSTIHGHLADEPDSEYTARLRKTISIRDDLEQPLATADVSIPALDGENGYPEFVARKQGPVTVSDLELVTSIFARGGALLPMIDPIERVQEYENFLADVFSGDDEVASAAIANASERLLPKI